MIEAREYAEMLRIDRVIQRTGLGRSTIYDLIKRDSFPKQIKLGQRACGWLESEISEWLMNKAAQREGGVK